jgi:hypothetical protein
VDWSATRARLQELGAIRFSLETTTNGMYRFSCWLPSSRPGPKRSSSGDTRATQDAERIEAVASTEAEAVRAGLERASHFQLASR